MRIPRSLARAGHDELGDSRWQAIDQAPQRHGFFRPARLQVRRVGRVHGETRPGRLAERERRAGVIDVVVREDDPIDRAKALLFDESKDRAEAARIARIDDSETLAAVVQIGLGAADARNQPDHRPIIGPGGVAGGRRSSQPLYVKLTGTL